MPSNVWEFSYSSTYQGVQAVNTMCIGIEGGTPDPLGLPAATVVADIDAQLRATYRGLLQTAWSLDSASVRELLTATPTKADLAVGQAGLLGVGTGNLPVEVCQVLSFSTALATRSGRGRMFLPSPFYSSYLSAPDVWATGGGYWVAAASFANVLTTPWTVVHGPTTYHYASYVFSRHTQSIHAITGYVRRSRPHWLRSRSTAP